MPTLKDPQRPVITAEDAELARRAARGRIVLIDDEPAILEAMAALLRDEGYACATYASADDYLLLDHDQPRFAGPLCVLTDVRMPGRNGLILQEILAREGVPVVLMSGTSGAQEAVTGFRAGAVDFLLKPVEEDALLAAVARALALDEERREKLVARVAISRRLAELTPREVEVAHLVRSGLRNQDIAQRLGIVERTVKHHRQQVLAKLEVNNLMELAAVLDAAESGPQ
jgi:two-component system response regulator FixJ